MPTTLDARNDGSQRPSSFFDGQCWPVCPGLSWHLPLGSTSKQQSTCICIAINAFRVDNSVANERISACTSVCICAPARLMRIYVRPLVCANPICPSLPFAFSQI